MPFAPLRPPCPLTVCSSRRPSSRSSPLSSYCLRLSPHPSHRRQASGFNRRHPRSRRLGRAQDDGHGSRCGHRRCQEEERTSFMKGSQPALSNCNGQLRLLNILCYLSTCLNTALTSSSPAGGVHGLSLTCLPQNSKPRCLLLICRPPSVHRDSRYNACHIIYSLFFFAPFPHVWFELGVGVILVWVFFLSPFSF